MTTKPYLDCRARVGESPCPIKIAINCRGSSVYIPTGIKVLPEQWDKVVSRVVAHPLKTKYNIAIQEKKLEIDKAIDELRKEGRIHGKTLSEIRGMVISRIEGRERVDEEPKFLEYFARYAASKTKYGTVKTYAQTEKKIRLFCQNADRLRFENIDKAWLTRFDAFMTRTAPSANARSIHLRNIRTVFNDALDNGMTQATYPFRRFKILSEPTKDRSLSIERLQAFFSAPCSPSQEEYRDIFKLSLLLCGINLADLARVDKLTNGRVEILRAKTGQPISIGVNDLALDIINKYKGKDHLLAFADRYTNYRDYMHRLNDAIKKIGKIYNPHTKKWEGKSICPEISYYYARYSWATIAAELDVPERTIGAALGHSTKGAVTAIYTRVDMRRKIDEANKRVVAAIFCELRK